MKKTLATILVCDKEVDSDDKYIKRKIGVVFQESLLDKSLTVYDNLKIKASLYGITGNNFVKRYNELSKLFDLYEIERQTISQLSGGQKRRVDIARAMIHNPEPGTRKKIWKVLNSLRKNSKLTIFLTTHYMEEAVDSDYIVILDKGSIVAEGTPLELKNKFAYDMILIYNINEDEIKKLNKPYTKIRDGFKIEIKTLEEATELIIKNKSLFKDYEVVKGKMDDVFLNATGYDLEVE